MLSLWANWLVTNFGLNSLKRYLWPVLYCKIHVHVSVHTYMYMYINKSFVWLIWYSVAHRVRLSHCTVRYFWHPLSYISPPVIQHRWQELSNFSLLTHIRSPPIHVYTAPVLFLSPIDIKLCYNGLLYSMVRHGEGWLTWLIRPWSQYALAPFHTKQTWFMMAITQLEVLTLHRSKNSSNKEIMSILIN